jgi:hypothetical protein
MASKGDQSECMKDETFATRLAGCMMEGTASNNRGIEIGM